MKLKRLLPLFLLMVGLGMGCRQATNNAVTLATPGLQPVSAPGAPVAEVAAGEPAETPKIKAAKITQIERPAGLQSTEIRLGMLSVTTPVAVNELVTLVPLGVELPALQTRVVNVTASENPCSDALPKIYEVELAPLTEAAWLQLPTPFTERRFSENAPFEVCVIFAAIKQAHALNRGLLAPNQLPRRVRLQNVITALDITGDETADLLVVESCCDKPQLDRHACDLTCTSVYRRAANGLWQLIEKQSPC